MPESTEELVARYVRFLVREHHTSHSQRATADAFDISGAWVSSIKNGNPKIRTGTLKKIAQQLHPGPDSWETLVARARKAAPTLPPEPLDDADGHEWLFWFLRGKDIPSALAETVAKSIVFEGGETADREQLAEHALARARSIVAEAKGKAVGVQVVEEEEASERKPPRVKRKKKPA